MSNQEKFTTQSSKLKVQKANSQTKLSCPVTFSVHIIFSSLVSFAICVLMFVFALKLRTYILIHIRLCRQLKQKKIILKRSFLRSICCIILFCLELYRITQQLRGIKQIKQHKMVTKRTILTIHSFFSIGFSFMNILETQESRGRGRLFL